MIREILYKVFNIEPFPCLSCETLKQQLSESNAERRALLEVILEKNSTPFEETTKAVSIEELKPIGPRYVPWKVRQQALETEDRERAKVLNKLRKEEELVVKNELEELEEEVLGDQKSNA